MNIRNLFNALEAKDDLQSLMSWPHTSGLNKDLGTLDPRNFTEEKVKHSSIWYVTLPSLPLHLQHAGQSTRSTYGIPTLSTAETDPGVISLLQYQLF